MLEKGQSGYPHQDPPRREVLDNVEAQLLSAKLFKSASSAARLEQLSASTSIVPIVPLLAAVHGLGTGSLALCHIFGFDLLHVRVLVDCLLSFVSLTGFSWVPLLHGSCHFFYQRLYFGLL